MVTAGVKRVAELCGGDDVHGNARRKPSSRARCRPRGRARCERRFCLWRSTPRPRAFPFPGSRTMTNRENSSAPGGTSPIGSAPARARRRRRLGGAAAPATRAALATLAVTLVASVVREVSRVEKTSRTSRTSALRDALRDLRARPPAVAARGASVEQSALTRLSVLCAGSLARVSARRREDRAEDRSNPTISLSSDTRENKNNSAWISARSVSRGVDAPARVVALRGVELGRPLLRERRRERDVRVRTTRDGTVGASRDVDTRRADAEHAIDDGTQFRNGLGARVRGAVARGGFGVARRGLGGQSVCHFAARGEQARRPRRVRAQARLGKRLRRAARRAADRARARCHDTGAANVRRRRRGGRVPRAQRGARTRDVHARADGRASFAALLSAGSAETARGKRR